MEKLWCLVRFFDDGESTVACWGKKKIGPLFFNSIIVAQKYARDVAERSGLEGPWNVWDVDRLYNVKDSRKYIIETWGNGKCFWVYVNANYHLFVKGVQ